MAISGDRTLFDLQREMMADDLRQEAARRAPSRGPAKRGQAPPRRRQPPADVHELLKQEVFSASAPSCDQHFEKSRPCPSTVYGVSDQYLVLDSFEKLQTSRPERGEFSFSFMVQGVTRDQAIGVADRLDTIIGAQVAEFCIPLLPPDDFDPARIRALNSSLPAGLLVGNGALPDPGDPTESPASQVPFCRRVTMLFREVGLQSISDADDRRHHFEFDASLAGPEGAGPGAPAGDRIRLRPLADFGYYLFTDPIQDVHDLTVQFYNPGRELRFPPDVLYGAAASGVDEGGGGASVFLSFSFLDFSNLVNLAVGDRIFIRGFQTKDHPLLNSYVSRPEGHLVGEIGFSLDGPGDPGAPPSGTRLAFRLNPDVDLDVLGIAAGPLASKKEIEVRIAKNRLRIPLRLRRVVPRLTNYISP